MSSGRRPRFVQVFLFQEPAHEFAACRGTAETAGFLAHEEDDVQGTFVPEMVFLHAAGYFDGAKDAADPVIVAALGYAVRMGAAHDGGQVLAQSPAVADDIAEGVGPDFQTGFLHEGQEIVTALPVRGREGDAVDAFGAVGVGRDGIHMVDLCLQSFLRNHDAFLLQKILLVKDTINCINF